MAYLNKGLEVLSSAEMHEILEQYRNGCLGCYREMLRIKRSVAASFSQIHYNTTIVEAATTVAPTGAGSFDVYIIDILFSSSLRRSSLDYNVHVDW